MQRRKKSLLLATIILLAVTIFWVIAFYQHVQAYYRIMQAYEENGELGDLYGLREPLFAWGNGPILMIIGMILLFAWIFVINEWWRVLNVK